jgi:hypothetical protein
VDYLRSAKAWASRLDGTVEIDATAGGVTIRGPRTPAERERLYERMDHQAREAETALLEAVTWLQDCCRRAIR